MGLPWDRMKQKKCPVDKPEMRHLKETATPDLSCVILVKILIVVVHHYPFPRDIPFLSIIHKKSHLAILF